MYFAFRPIPGKECTTYEVQLVNVSGGLYEYLAPTCVNMFFFNGRQSCFQAKKQSERLGELRPSRGTYLKGRVRFGLVGTPQSLGFSVEPRHTSEPLSTTSRKLHRAVPFHLIQASAHCCPKAAHQSP